jgi:hypothetical protein
MKRFVRRPPVATLVFTLTLASAAYSQEPQPRSLGDVAREAQESRKLENKTKAARIYTEIGDGSSQSEPVDLKPSAEPAAGTPVAEAKNKPATMPSAGEPTKPVSVFDRAKRKQAEFIIVPAGTEIRVDIIEGKVVVPVRVGFATPIPALSPAAVKLNQNFYTPVFYNVVAGSPANAAVPYGESAELTSITVRGVNYPVRATAVPLNRAATLGTSASIQSNRDATFVLTAPLPIER